VWLPLEARRVEAGREVGGLGGSREGVGKTDGLGEGHDSDIVEVRVRVSER